MKRPAVYILANKRNGALYTGVTSDLVGRVYRHRHSLTPGFASRYGCKLLVWYEVHDEMISAIAREKQIKAGSRRNKLALIEAMNSRWRDLYDDLVWPVKARPHNDVIASDRRERGNPGTSRDTPDALDCFVAALLAMTRQG